MPNPQTLINTSSWPSHHCRKVSLTAKLFVLKKSVLIMPSLIRNVLNQKHWSDEQIYHEKVVSQEVVSQVVIKSLKNTKKLVVKKGTQ